jgi:hypothetical protein
MRTTGNTISASLKSGLLDRCLAPKGTWPHVWQKRATLNPVRFGQSPPAFCFGRSRTTSTRWGLAIARQTNYCDGAPFWWAGAAMLDTNGKIMPLTESCSIERRKLRKTCLHLLSGVGVVGQDEVINGTCAIHVRRLVHMDEYKLLPQVWLRQRV